MIRIKLLGAAAAEKKDLINVQTNLKLSMEEVETLIAKIRTELLEVVDKNSLKKEKDFLLSKIKGFTIPLF